MMVHCAMMHCLPSIHNTVTINNLIYYSCKLYSPQEQDREEQEWLRQQKKKKKDTKTRERRTKTVVVASKKKRKKRNIGRSRGDQNRKFNSMSPIDSRTWNMTFKWN